MQLDNADISHLRYAFAFSLLFSGVSFSAILELGSRLRWAVWTAIVSLFVLWMAWSQLPPLDTSATTLLYAILISTSLLPCLFGSWPSASFARITQISAFLHFAVESTAVAYARILFLAVRENELATFMGWVAGGAALIVLALSVFRFRWSWEEASSVVLSLFLIQLAILCPSELHIVLFLGILGVAILRLNSVFPASERQLHMSWIAFGSGAWIWAMTLAVLQGGRDGSLAALWIAILSLVGVLGWAHKKNNPGEIANRMSRWVWIFVELGLVALAVWGVFLWV